MAKKAFAISKPCVIYLLSLYIKTLQNKRYETDDYCNSRSGWLRKRYGCLADADDTPCAHSLLLYHQTYA